MTGKLQFYSGYRRYLLFSMDLSDTQFRELCDSLGKFLTDIDDPGTYSLEVEGISVLLEEAPHESK